MKRAIVLCLALVVSLFAVTGSIAYFTDSIDVQNVVKSGNLDIEQYEFERKKNADGSYTNALQQYSQNQVIYPSVGTVSHPATAAEYTYTITDEKGISTSGTMNASLMDESLRGFVDKIVVAKNGNSLRSYVRTFVAVPTAFAEAIHLDWNTAWTVVNTPFTANITYTNGDHQINGVDYTIWYATYHEPLDPGAIAPPSLLGFYLDSQVNHNGTCYTLNKVELGTGSELKILVATQASQVIPIGIEHESHDDAETSMFKTYGTPGADHHPWATVADTPSTDNQNEVTPDQAP